MTVLFICSSLEPGRDGVGDYTRRLAAELIRQGHSASAIGLHDAHLGADSLKESQFDERQWVNVLRLSPRLPWEKRLAQAVDFIAMKKPDWISLQYVSYGFDGNGLPWQLPGRIRMLATGRRLHIMFHELWLDQPLNIKELILARIQKTMISSGIKEMKPAIMNVTIPFNSERLQAMDYQASRIGLFGNIPFHEDFSGRRYAEGQSDRKRRHLLYFGTPPKGKFMVKLVDELVGYCASTGVRFHLSIISGHSAQKDRFVEMLKSRLDHHHVHISDLGFASPDRLSDLMCSCCLGICRSDPHLLGKSGSAVAMLEHGLPIWLPKWNGTDSTGLDFRSDLVFSDLTKALNTPAERVGYSSLLKKTARNFIEQLT